MERTLLFVRHAKTKRESSTGLDQDRMLTKRGMNDAHMQSERMKEWGLYPDVIITSHALRARQTADIIQSYFPETPLLIDPSIYLCPSHHFDHVIQLLDDQWKQCILVGHNPGMWEYLYNWNKQIEAFPTASMAMFRIQTAHWADSLQHTKSFIHFESPKHI